jgi:hypothetical protein
VINSSQVSRERLTEVFRERLENVSKEIDAVLKILEDARDPWKEYAKLCNELQEKPNSPGIAELQEKVNALYIRLKPADEAVRKLVREATEVLKVVPLSPQELQMIKYEIENAELFIIVPHLESLLPLERFHGSLSNVRLWFYEMEDTLARASRPLIAIPGETTQFGIEAAASLRCDKHDTSARDGATPVQLVDPLVASAGREAADSNTKSSASEPPATPDAAPLSEAANDSHSDPASHGGPQAVEEPGSSNKLGTTEVIKVPALPGDPSQLTACPPQGITERAIMDDRSNQPEAAHHLVTAAAPLTTSCLQILREAMDQQGLNSPGIARKIQAILKPEKGNRLKVDRTTVYRIVQGRTTRPQPEVREALIKVLGLTGEKASIVRRGLGGTGAAQDFPEQI